VFNDEEETCTGHDFPKISNPSLKKTQRNTKKLGKLKINPKSHQIEIFLKL
jgi:hypothetical protein